LPVRSTPPARTSKRHRARLTRKRRFATEFHQAKAVEVGRDTVRIALQSIWLGIIVSVALMIVAAFGVIPATVGALLQEVVDLVTILAALRAIGGRLDAKAATPAAAVPAASAR